MVLVAGSLGGRVPFPLDALDVQQHRLGDRHVVADVLEDGHQVVQVVRVHGPDVVEAQLLEQSAARCDAAHVLVEAFVQALHRNLKVRKRMIIMKRLLDLSDKGEDG